MPRFPTFSRAREGSRRSGGRRSGGRRASSSEVNRRDRERRGRGGTVARANRGGRGSRAPARERASGREVDRRDRERRGRRGTVAQANAGPVNVPGGLADRRPGRGRGRGAPDDVGTQRRFIGGPVDQGGLRAADFLTGGTLSTFAPNQFRNGPNTLLGEGFSRLNPPPPPVRPSFPDFSQAFSPEAAAEGRLRARGLLSPNDFAAAQRFTGAGTPPRFIPEGMGNILAPPTPPAPVLDEPQFVQRGIPGEGQGLAGEAGLTLDPNAPSPNVIPIEFSRDVPVTPEGATRAAEWFAYNFTHVVDPVTGEPLIGQQDIDNINDILLNGTDEELRLMLDEMAGMALVDVSQPPADTSGGGFGGGGGGFGGGGGGRGGGFGGGFAPAPTPTPPTVPTDVNIGSLLSQLVAREPGQIYEIPPLLRRILGNMGLGNRFAWMLQQLGFEFAGDIAPDGMPNDWIVPANLDAAALETLLAQLDAADRIVLETAFAANVGLEVPGGPVTTPEETEEDVTEVA